MSATFEITVTCNISDDVMNSSVSALLPEMTTDLSLLVLPRIIRLMERRKITEASIFADKIANIMSMLKVTEPPKIREELFNSLLDVWTMAVIVWGDSEAARRFLLEPHQLFNGQRPIDAVFKDDERAVINILGRLQNNSAV